MVNLEQLEGVITLSILSGESKRTSQVVGVTRTQEWLRKTKVSFSTSDTDVSPDLPEHDTGLKLWSRSRENDISFTFCWKIVFDDFEDPENGPKIK